MNETTKELVALAAAVAGKCQPCFACHYQKAQQLGVPQEQIDEAVQLARDIRASGDMHMDEFAKRRIKENKGQQNEDTDIGHGMPEMQEDRRSC